MKGKIHIKNISELLPSGTSPTDIRVKINCTTIDSTDVLSQFSVPLYLNASIAILVLSGNATACINYKFHKVEPDTLLLLSASHMFNFDNCSADFKCICLFVSKDFMDDMDSTDMIYKRIKYGVRMFNMPVLRISNHQSELLYKRITSVNDAIEDAEHLYHKEIILNCLFGFYLDLSNMIDRTSCLETEANLTRYESIIKSFIELLVANYRKEHKVDFYSSRLNISDHYLIHIVKRITGQTVTDFIYEMLYSDARTLLMHSKLSIQEITSLLHFSDQSSFGKFFKRKAGLSPIDFRKQMK